MAKSEVLHIRLNFVELANMVSTADEYSVPIESLGKLAKLMLTSRITTKPFNNSDEAQSFLQQRNLIKGVDEYNPFAGVSNQPMKMPSLTEIDQPSFSPSTMPVVKNSAADLERRGVNPPYQPAAIHPELGVDCHGVDPGLVHQAMVGLQAKADEQILKERTEKEALQKRDPMGIMADVRGLEDEAELVSDLVQQLDETNEAFALRKSKTALSRMKTISLNQRLQGKTLLEQVEHLKELILNYNRQRTTNQAALVKAINESNIPLIGRIEAKEKKRQDDCLNAIARLFSLPVDPNIYVSLMKLPAFLEYRPLFADHFNELDQLDKSLNAEPVEIANRRRTDEEQLALNELGNVSQVTTAIGHTEQAAIEE